MLSAPYRRAGHTTLFRTKTAHISLYQRDIYVSYVYFFWIPYKSPIVTKSFGFCWGLKLFSFLRLLLVYSSYQAKEYSPGFIVPTNERTTTRVAYSV